MKNVTETAKTRRVLMIIQDVEPFEELVYDRRLPEPQLVFGGMISQKIVKPLTVPGENPEVVVSRPVYHAIFVVPSHLVSDERAVQIARRKNAVTVTEDADPASQPS